jgi:hypothetical protein
MTLNRLIAEAVVLGGGKHQCAELGHDWETQGGRQCPYATDEYNLNCSQSVYVCRACGCEDYGEEGGPGYQDCHVDGPCSFACEQAADSVRVEEGK